MSKILSLVLVIGCLLQTACISGEDSAPPPPIRDFSVINENEAWLVTSAGKVFHFLNGGQTMEEVKFETTVRQIFFLNTNKGWRLDSDGQIWTTENGGKDWSKVGKFAGDPTSHLSNQFVFINEQIGWFVAIFGNTWLTEDGGNSWTQIYPTDEFSYNTLGGDPFTYFPVDANVGWLGMANGKILRTTNRGKNWENVSFKGDSTRAAVYGFNKDECFVSAFERFGIYHTTNGGQNWDQVLKSEDKENIGYYSINFATPQIGWAGGIKFSNDFRSVDRLNGVTLKTTDGGKNWNRQIGEFYKTPFRKIKFTDERNGWLISENEMYHTTDGGENWAKVFETESRYNKK